MICVGIDVAKDKHDCFILSSEGVALADVFTIPNSLEGFNILLDKLRAYSGMSPSTYQSGQLKNRQPHMEKRGSRYLR